MKEYGQAGNELEDLNNKLLEVNARMQQFQEFKKAKDQYKVMKEA